MSELIKITRITTQKKNKHRYNIFIDEGQGERFGFSVDEDVLIQYNLRKGLELDDAMQATLREQDTWQQSYSKVIGYLGYRMRTKQEVYDYLLKNDVEQEHVAEIIERLIEQNLLDDRAFSEAFVNTRVQTTLKGPALIKQELLQKGVSADIADEAVMAIDTDVQYEKAQKIVEKKLKKSSKHSQRKQLQNIQANLLRQGFSESVIQDVLAEASAMDKDAEWEALVYQGERLLRRHQQKTSGFDLQQKIKAGLYRQGFDMEHIGRFLDALET